MKENISNLELGFREEIKWYIIELINSEVCSNENKEKLKDLTESDINDIANDMLYDDNLFVYIENDINFRLSDRVGSEL
jgi:hypothetical protein